jgi:hypothetical protein
MTTPTPSPDRVAILVVNDREDQLLATSAILEPLGHRIVTASSGPEALRHLLEEDFAVMLLDVNMPGMDGFEIAGIIRSRPKLELLPIIFVTATNQSSGDSLRGYESGAVDYVHVPVAPDILRAKVNAFVRMHRMNAEIRRQAEDLTRLNGELQRQAGRLTEVNEELEAFSYSVSHDLRAPLRIIDQYGAILIESHAGQLDADGLALLDRIRANGRRMGQLIEDLLNLSHISQGALDLTLVDLSALAAETVAELRQQHPGRVVEAVIQPGMTARADRGLMRTLFANLLGNAWKYTARRASARIAVTCGPTVRGESTFAVADDGVGFDMAFADRLFAPFQRMHSAAEFTGSGIGLSIVARIIRRHGGQVWAEAAPDRGATFRFTLAP